MPKSAVHSASGASPNRKPTLRLRVLRALTETGASVSTSYGNDGLVRRVKEAAHNAKEWSQSDQVPEVQQVSPA